MKNYFCKNFSKSIPLVIFFLSLISLSGDLTNAEYLLEDLEMDSSTKTNENSSVIPNNPLELIKMIRRQVTMNDATNPSDAIDDALKSFNNLEEK